MVLKLILKRNGTYYFRWQVPFDARQALGTSEIRRSLHTSNQRIALERAEGFYLSVQKIKKARNLYRMKQLTEANYQAVLALLKEDLSGPSEKPDTIDELRALKEELPQLIEYLKDASMTESGMFLGDDSEAESAYDYIKSLVTETLGARGIAGNSEELLSKLVHDYIHVHIQRAEDQLSSLTYPSKPNAQSTFQNLRSGFLEAPTSHNNLTTLVAAWDDYVRDKKDSGKWKVDSDIEERSAEFRDFIEIIGGNRAATSFSKADAREFRSALIKYPKNRRKLYGETPLADIPEDAPAISSSTAKQRLDQIKSFFLYLVSEEIIHSSPFTNIQIEAQKKSYATYTDTDLKELFNLPKGLVKKEWQYWIPRIALYSGARQDEIAQLRVGDVCKDTETGVWYFSINDKEDKSVKTVAAIRRIPLASELIKHGFLDYLNSLPGNAEAPLWGDLGAKGGKKGQTVSRYWTDLKSKHKRPSKPTDHQGGNKVFHSLRRVFINRLKQASVDTETIQLLVGHEPDLGTTRIYLDDISKPLPELSQAVEKVEYTGIGWRD